MSNVTIYTLAKELNMTPSMISRAFSPNGKISEEKRKIIGTEFFKVFWKEIIDCVQSVTVSIKASYLASNSIALYLI